VGIKHTDAADGSFSGTGATNWNKDHTVDVVGVLKGTGSTIAAAVVGIDIETPTSGIALSIAMAQRNNSY